MKSPGRPPRVSLGGASCSSVNNNPMDYDPQLSRMIGQVENITKYRQFVAWKASFLRRLETFLEAPGMEEASRTYHDHFGARLDQMIHSLEQCQFHIEQGVLTSHKVTVKGRSSLNECAKELTLTCEATQALIPTTSQEERDCGYDKFQLGAVLVRDGFTEYDRLLELREACVRMHQISLPEVADKQQLDLMEQYCSKFQNFCDILADLSLYEVMLACRRFATEPEYESESESEPELEPERGLGENIFLIDFKEPAQLWQIDREEAFQHGYLARKKLSSLHPKEAAEIPDIETTPSGLHMLRGIVGTTLSVIEREEIRDKLKSHPTLGIATTMVVQAMIDVDQEHTELQEAEKVNEVWGVQLKKRTKREAGVDCFFVDPYTTAVGWLDRNKLEEGGFFGLVKAKQDEEVADGSHRSEMEAEEKRERMVLGIRRVLNIRLDAA